MTEDELKQLIHQLEISMDLDGEIPITNRTLLNLIKVSSWNTKIKHLDELKKNRDKILDEKYDRQNLSTETEELDDIVESLKTLKATNESVTGGSNEIDLDTTKWRKSKSIQEHVQPVTTEPFTVWASADYLPDSFFEDNAPKAWFFDHHTTAWELIAPFSGTCDHGELGMVHTKPSHEDICRIFPLWTYKENIVDLHEFVDFSKTE